MDPAEEDVRTAKKDAAAKINIVEMFVFVCVFMMLAVALTDILYSMTTGGPSALFGVSISPKWRDDTEL